MSEEKSLREKKRCITPPFRLSFPAVWKPKSFKNQEPKFSVTMLFDPKADLVELRRAIRYAFVEKYGEDQTKWPKNWKKLRKAPFRDGNDKADLDGYADQTVVVAKANVGYPPSVIDRDGRTKITEADGKLLAGCICKASINAFIYTEPSLGVTFGLNNIQYISKGVPFSGRKDAEDEFDAVGDVEDDEDGGDDDDDDSPGF